MAEFEWEDSSHAIVKAPTPGVAAYWNGSGEVTVRVVRVQDGRLDEDLASIPPEALRDLASRLSELANEHDEGE